ncbi:ANTAR domain-containing protein [Couchioplanes caeruleus]|uniref:ANTAR domain-containing protein n=1 Tax=Couchioplanes caeruleus TaxID=56438 RepID=UPI00116081FB|nr:ANTAR domain-containing protein [Couchioplanes caeruleus]
MSRREQAVAQAFVELSDTLVGDFDVVEFLHTLAGRCVELVGVQAAGVMLADQRGGLRVLASSSEQARLLELFEVEADEGPCVDCYASGEPVADLDLDIAGSRWRGFAVRAFGAGFRSVHAVPVQLREQTIGVLNLFAVTPGVLSEGDAGTARALANTIALALVQHHAVAYRQVLAEQLQHTMTSRVVVEQAKGLLAELLDLDLAQAFAELRRLARRTGRRLSDVAADIATGDFASVAPEPETGRSRVLLIRRIYPRNGTRTLRAEIRSAAARHGLAASQQAAFTLAVHEAVVNTLEHGGGSGRLIMWRYHGSLYAEISDHGPGLPQDYQIRAGAPSTGPGTGRGLWVINRICTSLDIDTGPTGTHLMLRYALNSPPPEALGPPPQRIQD